MNKQNFLLRLQSVRQITHQVKHFIFVLEDPTETFIFIPGQFISLHIPFSDKNLRRSYSLANSPEEASISKCLELAASYVPQGIASDFLFALKPGDTVEASGPSGRLILRDEQPQRYLLIATGTGVTPYRTMLPELARRMRQQSNLVIKLLLGVRTFEEALYWQEFAAFSKQYPQFQFQLCYSRQQYPSDLAQEDKTSVSEYQGYVSKAIQTIPLDPAGDIVYLCGNPNMVDDNVAFLTHQGFSPDKIRREKYVSSKPKERL
jgi:ferredoxin-NADP reductase